MGGIGLFPDDATGAAVLIQQGDSAMYAVKHDGKNGARNRTEAMYVKGD
jgi:GGDEF domain-containing protein